MRRSVATFALAVPLLGLGACLDDLVDDDDDPPPVVPARDGGVARDGGGAPPDAGGDPPDATPAADAGRDGGGPVTSPACAAWNAATDDVAEGTWAGSAAPLSCIAGDMDAAWRGRTLAMMNAYRALADLPPVTDDATRNAKAQECALMMHAEGRLSHGPGESWACYSADGAEAAGRSNIASAPAVGAVSLYMVDPGNETTLGHRRWILSNSLGPTGLGSTDEYSCMWTLGGSGAAGRAWTAFPPPGDFPIQAARLIGVFPFTELDDTGYSLQSDQIDLDAATVTVTEDGAPYPVTVTSLLPNYGSRWALKLLPAAGRGLQVGRTYRVVVDDVALPGGATSFEYAFRVVDCDAAR